MKMKETKNDQALYMYILCMYRADFQSNQYKYLILQIKYQVNKASFRFIKKILTFLCALKS